MQKERTCTGAWWTWLWKAPNRWVENKTKGVTVIFQVSLPTGRGVFLMSQRSAEKQRPGRSSGAGISGGLSSSSCWIRLLRAKVFLSQDRYSTASLGSLSWKTCFFLISNWNFSSSTFPFLQWAGEVPTAPCVTSERSLAPTLSLLWHLPLLDLVRFLMDSF